MWIIRDQMNPINKPVYCAILLKSSGYPQSALLPVLLLYADM
jgi:hypothetical protein